MQYHRRCVVSILVLIFTLAGHTALFCPTVPLHHLRVNAIGNDSLTSVQQQCFTIGHCHLTIITRHDHHLISFKRHDIEPVIFLSAYPLLIEHNQNTASLRVSSILADQIINSTDLSIEVCSKARSIQKRSSSRSASSTIVTFNSSSYIDYHHAGTLEYPLRLSLRFRTLGRISSGVLLSLTHRTSSSLIIPYIIIEHSNGKVEITILQLDERKVLATVTTIQAGKNINNDHWHWLQFEIDQNGIFTLIVNDDTRKSQIPSYVVTDWHINALLVGDTRRLSSDIFQPFIGYMSDLVFNDEHLFARFPPPGSKEQPINSSFQYTSQDLLIGYRIAFFNLVTIDTATSYIAFSERESQNKNHGKLDIYFLFRSYVPDGIILYRYAQGLNEYFAIGLRAGVLAVFIDFGFGKRQIVSDESTKLADGKWHEVRVTRLGTDKIELIVDNRVNRSTLSANGIRNAVSLQPVLYIGGIPNSNNINLTGSGLNAQGFQGCLASFIVDGRILDYQRALVLNGQVKMNVCSDASKLLTTNSSDLNKLCYDFTCIHSGVCSTNGDNAPKCDCIETAYTGDRCDKLSKGFYFGQRHSVGLIEYTLPQPRQTEYDVIVFGIQTLSTTTQVLRIESDLKLYSLEYEIIRGRSYIKLHLGEKQPDVYSAVAHVTDGMFHVIRIVRRLAAIEFYVDGIRVRLEGGNKASRQAEQRVFLAQRRLRIGSFKNLSQWNGIIAGLSLNRQSIFDSLSRTLVRSGDVEDVYPDEQTGLFNLIESFHIATAMMASSSTPISTTNNSTASTLLVDSVTETSYLPMIDPLHQQEEEEEEEDVTRTAPIAPRSTRVTRISFQWFYNHLKRVGLRGLIISAAVSMCLLLLLFFIIIRLHRRNRQSAKNPVYPYNQTNGKAYSQIKRPSIAPPNGQQSKKRVPKLLRYLHSNRSKPSSSSFRFTSNGSLSRLSSGDSYHLIAAIQENHRDQKRLSNKSSNCVLNDHCYIHSTFSQPVPSPPSLYHQVNRLMLSGSEPPLPFSHPASCRPPISTTATLRSMKKDIDNSSVQTYSAVYSCDLAANLDLDHDGLPPARSTSTKRIVSKPSPTANPLVYLFMKNLVDCYAVQVHQQQMILLASADDNKIQLSHARSGHFHSQLPVTSLGACHQIIYSYQDRYLIGLFYEVTSNVNPYAVKIWSTHDYAIRANVHPIKCSIAVPSRQSSVLFMAGKQKYGRGISLGLLDLDACSLSRELKSDPDTSIGDEIKRIILTKNESYALVACTEHTSTCTCFVVFKLELPSSPTDELDSAALGSMSNCTMILTRFDCEANFTFSIVDSNNNGDQYMLTILRANQMIIWQLSDGEILVSYDLSFLNDDDVDESSEPQQIIDCQMDDNRLMVLARSGSIHIWDVTVPVGEFSYITMIRDPLIHSVNWLDHRHFVSVDNDGQRLRLWDLDQKESIHEALSLSSGVQSLHVYPLLNQTTNGKDYLIVGLSMNERSLVMFECNPLRDEPVPSSSPMIIC